MTDDRRKNSLSPSIDKPGTDISRLADTRGAIFKRAAVEANTALTEAMTRNSAATTAFNYQEVDRGKSIEAFGRILGTVSRVRDVIEQDELRMQREQEIERYELDTGVELTRIKLERARQARVDMEDMSPKLTLKRRAIEEARLERDLLEIENDISAFQSNIDKNRKGDDDEDDVIEGVVIK